MSKFEAYFTINGKEHEMKGISALDRLRIAGIAGRQNFMGSMNLEVAEMQQKLAGKDPEKWTRKEREMSLKVAAEVTNKMLTIIATESDEMFALWSNMTGVSPEDLKKINSDDFDSLFEAFKKVGGFEAFSKAVTSLN
ncbi:hypothetical protein [Bacillus sp. COPE52]|uniref:hypothetical protein n=1 Tax=Bacillus sp. COPE52 TaxID=2233998 RepID=UPI000E102955|nr:hypothetical protein [Bacillus sp. COPE52]AXK19124.1 hypothetical protein DPQ31_16060 [Bacillus sp. COPE52]